MSEQEQEQQAPEAKAFKEKEVRTDARPIEDVAKALEGFEGYTVFEEAIPESKGLNPARPARREIFKKDASSRRAGSARREIEPVAAADEGCGQRGRYAAPCRGTGEEGARDAG
ncbi:MAG: hypothetical protein IPH53_16465 [Flavobacteriales bacterium]|nr:hypothetical protein [Flavobacteriales bacterium]